MGEGDYHPLPIIVKTTIPINDVDPTILFGCNDEFLKKIQSRFNVSITLRSNALQVRGDEKNVRDAARMIRNMVNAGETSVDADVYRRVSEHEEHDPSQVTTPKKLVKAKTEGQTRYLSAIDNCDIVISIGPAGTGKTYLGVAKAVSHLMAHKVDRIVLTRPAVEAGESLGFLPGAIEEKVDPYLRPLYDALSDFLPFDRIKKYLAMKTIEVAPLAYMRGRTLNDSFIILDEAQNSTSMQMKMFLTRMGWRSKVVVTGDITQVDLPANVFSGLIEVQHLLKAVGGIEFVYLNEKDVVRHHLVQRIIKAYEDKDRS